MSALTEAADCIATKIDMALAQIEAFEETYLPVIQNSEDERAGRAISMFYAIKENIEAIEKSTIDLCETIIK